MSACSQAMQEHTDELLDCISISNQDSTIKNITNWINDFQTPNKKETDFFARDELKLRNREYDRQSSHYQTNTPRSNAALALLNSHITPNAPKLPYCQSDFQCHTDSCPTSHSSFSRPVSSYRSLQPPYILSDSYSNISHRSRTLISPAATRRDDSYSVYSQHRLLSFNDINSTREYQKNGAPGAHTPSLPLEHIPTVPSVEKSPLLSLYSTYQGDLSTPRHIHEDKELSIRTPPIETRPLGVNGGPKPLPTTLVNKYGHKDDMSIPASYTAAGLCTTIKKEGGREEKRGERGDRRGERDGGRGERGGMFHATPVKFEGRWMEEEKEEEKERGGGFVTVEEEKSGRNFGEGRIGKKGEMEKRREGKSICYSITTTTTVSSYVVSEEEEEMNGEVMGGELAMVKGNKTRGRNGGNRLVTKSHFQTHQKICSDAAGHFLG